MTKYRILEIPQIEGGVKYRVQRNGYESKNHWWAKLFLGGEIPPRIIRWYDLDYMGDVIYYNYHRPVQPSLELFRTIDSAKAYIKAQQDYRKKKSKIVFETEA